MSNEYERYLEELLEIKQREIEVKQKEIDFYKHFIEEKLRCVIKESINDALDTNGLGKRKYKMITIPQSNYIITLNDEITFGRGSKR